jgi:2-octaprenylphenol hydroxylase
MTDMSKVRSVDIAVAGAGMTGLAAAIQLADLGFKVEVLDQFGMDLSAIDEQAAQIINGAFDSRVSALTLASVQLLQSLGAWSHILEWRAEPYEKMHVWDGESRGEVDFDCFDIHERQLGFIVENRLIVLGLLKAALERPSLKLNFASRIKKLGRFQESSRRIELEDGDLLSVRLVVGADGAHSNTRKQLGLATHEWDYGQHAVVATLEMSLPHQHTCWQRFTEDGPLALLPLKTANAKQVSLVWSTSPKHAAELLEMDQEAFCAAVSFGSRNVLGKVVSACGIQGVPLRQRHAKHYVVDGGVLIGDAAHTIHPLAGQGVNLGFLDSAALHDVIEQAQIRREKIGDTRVLKRYERSRQLDNLRMSAAMEGFRRLFAPQPAPIEWARSVGMRLFNRVEPIKQHIMSEAMGLSGELPTRMRKSASTNVDQRLN